MRQALEMLGLKPYHTSDASKTKTLPYWLEAVKAKYGGQGRPYGKCEFDKLLGHCQGVSDMPAILFAEELIAAYPEAKVILTHRNFDTWYK